uniref:TNase-like domain-containing protein n=1 Tax=Archaeoglobus fulgidus TaxID=2234 RepID=A0A7J2TJL6_ARCFL
MRRILWAAVLLLVLCAEPEKALVVEVIDGDTIKLSNGELVRLLGINAPEKGQKFYEEAKKRLKELVEGKEVLLEKDREDKDRYGRLLRYVYVDGKLVNVLLVREGLAFAMAEGLKYERDFKEAEKFAREQKLGIWRDLDCRSCIGIAYMKLSADCKDEFLVLKNSCPFACNLTHWILSIGDKNFIFPEISLEGGKTVTIHSGCGENGGNFYLCSSCLLGKEGVIYLFDSEGKVVLSYAYGK